MRGLLRRDLLVGLPVTTLSCRRGAPNRPVAENEPAEIAKARIAVTDRFGKPLQFGVERCMGNDGRDHAHRFVGLGAAGIPFGRYELTLRPVAGMAPSIKRVVFFTERLNHCLVNADGEQPPACLEGEILEEAGSETGEVWVCSGDLFENLRAADGIAITKGAGRFRIGLGLGRHLLLFWKNGVPLAVRWVNLAATDVQASNVLLAAAASLRGLSCQPLPTRAAPSCRDGKVVRCEVRVVVTDWPVPPTEQAFRVLEFRSETDGRDRASEFGGLTMENCPVGWYRYRLSAPGGKGQAISGRAEIRGDRATLLVLRSVAGDLDTTPSRIVGKVHTAGGEHRPLWVAAFRQYGGRPDARAMVDADGRFELRAAPGVNCLVVLRGGEPIHAVAAQVPHWGRRVDVRISI